MKMGTKEICVKQDLTQTKVITVSGKVIKGDGYGKKIGFPTVNIDRRNFLKMKDQPAFGVYTGTVKLLTRVTLVVEYKAGIVIGPFDKKGLPKVEAHLIGYKGNAYGKKAELTLNKFLRKYKNFKTESELILQIKKDIELCK